MAGITASTAPDPDTVAFISEDPAKLFAIGRHLVGKGKYQEALKALKEAVALEPGEVVYQSYYGLCLVETGRGRKEGLNLCRQALQQAFYHVDLYVNLARAYLSMGDRKRAVVALKRGASVEPEDPVIRKLLGEVGRRRQPVFPFLSRAHPINKIAGRIRHTLLGSPK